jgi:hypothetical protein
MKDFHEVNPPFMLSLAVAKRDECLAQGRLMEAAILSKVIKQYKQEINKNEL